MKTPKLDPMDIAISGEPKTTPQQDALVRRIKMWLELKLKRWVGK